MTATQPRRSKWQAETEGASSKKKAKESKLASRVDQLTTVHNQMEAVYLALQTEATRGSVVLSIPRKAIAEPKEDQRSGIERRTSQYHWLWFACSLAISTAIS